MAAKRHHPAKMDHAAQEKRERELDAWLDRALHASAHKADPEPKLHDL